MGRLLPPKNGGLSKNSTVPSTSSTLHLQNFWRWRVPYPPPPVPSTSVFWREEPGGVMFGGGGSSTIFTKPSVFRREEPGGVMFGGGGSRTLHLQYPPPPKFLEVEGPVPSTSSTLHLRFLAGGAGRSNVWRWRVPC